MEINLKYRNVDNNFFLHYNWGSGQTRIVVRSDAGQPISYFDPKNALGCVARVSPSLRRACVLLMLRHLAIDTYSCALYVFAMCTRV